MTKWSQQARLQVLEAVIKVESEILSESSGRGLRAVGNRTSKWDRVASLLPRSLRGRTWNSKEKKPNRYKCSRLFYSLRKSYMKMLGNEVRSFLHVTEPEFALFEKREGLRQTWLAGQAGNALESGSANTNRGGSSLGFDTEQGECSVVEAASESGSLECYEITPQSEGEASDSEGQGKYLEQGGMEDIPNESGCLECYKFLPQLEGNMETTARDDNDNENSMERSSEAEAIAGVVKKRGRAPLAAVKSTERLASGLSHGSPSRSTSESGDRANKGKLAPRTPDEARALIRAKGRGSIVAARQPARRPRTSKSERQSISESSSEESNLDANLERPLKCLDLEFFHFSSWVKNEAIPVGRELVTGLSMSALRSGEKRRKLNAHRPPPRIGTGPFQGLMHMSSAGMIDSRIRALFQKLRIRFAAELEKTCEDIAQEVIDGA